MSKAFTRESDDLPERPAARRSLASSAGEDRFPLTPTGARLFREELERLLAGDAKDAADRTGADAARDRIAHLQRILAEAVVTELPAGPPDEVRLGATVTLTTSSRGRGGESTRYRLVGPNEVDLDRDWVNWRSPLGRALVGRRRGDRVRVRLPSGEEEFEIVDVRYE